MKKQLIAITGAIALSTAAFAGTASAKTVTIHAGDTLSGLAQTHGTTVNTLKQLNGLTSDLIYAGAPIEVGGSNGQAVQKTAYQAPVQKQKTYKAPVKQVQTQTTYKAPVQQKQTYKAPVQKQATTKAYTGSSSSAKSWIANKESTNNYNARSATGKYIGKYQLDKSYLNGDYSPANQERVADKYVKDRYGSWSNAKSAWQQKGWY
ncbi:LysM peptidoglycan-binding domain-containing protein [Kurthia sibirica]|uniref:LysM domain-containing protein n=2 Tax=Kurthia sibirica TaxID=202750 RepID=A0A2U3AEZ4_9BACL|nr:LysM peptidoglycan-binding domain-containing protein [Kurthia sibirica]PWI23116.1 hypothetical protein DEX24_16455 [Kurthia sibirica]